MAVLWGEVKEKVDKDISQLKASVEVCVCVCVDGGVSHIKHLTTAKASECEAHRVHHA